MQLVPLKSLPAHAFVEKGGFGREQARVLDSDVPARCANVLRWILRLSLPPGLDVAVLRIAEPSRRAIGPFLPTAALPGITSSQRQQWNEEPNTMRSAAQPESYAA